MIRAKLLPYFGKLKMRSITPQQIIRWQNELEIKTLRPFCRIIHSRCRVSSQKKALEISGTMISMAPESLRLSCLAAALGV